MSLTQSSYRKILVCLGIPAGLLSAWASQSLGTGLLVCFSFVLCALIAVLLQHTPTEAAEVSAEHGNELVSASLAAALDELPVGVLIIDVAGRFQLANQKFVNSLGMQTTDLLGKKARQFDWRWLPDDHTGSPQDAPHWLDAIRGSHQLRGRLSSAKVDETGIFQLTAKPILGPKTEPLGALFCFEDLSKILKKAAEVEALMSTIRQTSQQMRSHNLEREAMAQQDPLTGGLSRRAGLEHLDQLWGNAVENREDFSCALLDIDDFKQVNATFGRQTADQLLIRVSETIRETIRPSDIACRYSGEEFLILMPRTSLADGVFIADRVRQAIARLRTTEASITASIGVAAWSENCTTPQEFTDVLEHRMATAKFKGRNTVVKESSTFVSPMERGPSLSESVTTSSAIPFPAVSALVSAMKMCDESAVAHSRRVADLCVAVGQRLMSQQACHILETAAMLHEVGKLVSSPESQLAAPESADGQPEPFRPSQSGLRIIHNGFASSELASVIELAGCDYQRSVEEGLSLPLGARILRIADAYDTLVTDRSGEPALTRQQAIEELKKSAGVQFDPEIVEHFTHFLKLPVPAKARQIRVPRDVALIFGQQVEGLAIAVDRQDQQQLGAIASFLLETSNVADVAEVADKSSELLRELESDDDHVGILRSGIDLLNACRDIQATYLMGQNS